MRGQIKGKVALVTGGASGIGEAIVRRFVAEGVSTAFSDIDEQNGQALEAELKEAGHKVLFYGGPMDVEREAVGFVAAAVQLFGRVDILVNNAGIRLYQSVLEATEESWDKILGVNIKGVAFVCKAAIPAMKEAGGGAIVNMSSIRATIAGGNMVQYDTSKAAIDGMTRALAYDHAKDNIRVNAILPGSIFTQFHARRAISIGKTVDEFKRAFGQGSMLKRPGMPEEIASVALFLSSDESSYVTGASIYVDGGLSAVDPDTLTTWLQTGK